MHALKCVCVCVRVCVCKCALAYVRAWACSRMCTCVHACMTSCSRKSGMLAQASFSAWRLFGPHHLHQNEKTGHIHMNILWQLSRQELGRKSYIWEYKDVRLNFLGMLCVIDARSLAQCMRCRGIPRISASSQKLLQTTKAAEEEED